MKTFTCQAVLLILLSVLVACQKPAPDTEAAAPAPAVETPVPVSPTPAQVENQHTGNNWTACPEQRPEVCAQIYRPVCGTRDTGVRCVTTPCPSETTKTYGNACSACADPKVKGFANGECSASKASDR